MASEPGPSGIPVVEVRCLGCAPAGTDGLWRARWELTSASPLRVLAAWHPHGQFHAPELRLEPPLALAPGRSRELPTQVRCAEAPGAEIENGFLILRAEDEHGTPWRIFARTRVRVGDGGLPEPRVELVTAQRVGFSSSS